MSDNKVKLLIKLIWKRAVGPMSFIWQLRSEPLRYRWRLIIIGLLAVAVSVQALLMPQITRRIIDIAYPNRDFTLFYILTAIMVGLNLVSAVADSFSSYIRTYVSNLISFRLRMRVFHALHRVPVSYVERHQSGMFLERIARDADTTAEMLYRIIPEVISLLLTAIITITMMVNISPLVAGLVVAIVPLYYLISGVVAVKIRAWQQKVRKKDDQLTSMAVEAIQGVPTARLFGVGNWLRKLYTGLLRDRIKMAFGILRVQLTYGRLGWAVTYFWGVLLTFGGWYLVFQDRLTLGDAVALGMYIPMLLRPAEQALSLYQSLISSSVSAQRISEVLDAAQNGKPKDVFGRFEITKGVNIQNLKFSYPESSWSLGNISLDIPCSQTIVVLGATGSGKTTLLRLLAGMFDTYEGEILVDGRPLSSICLSSYQENVAMVMADNFFFTGSLMENMLIARSQLKPEMVKDAAKILGINDWLESLPEGYDTRLGVGGIRLSSGQTQKVAILRALLKNPRVLLLDEITSAMDVESERYILDGLQSLRRPEMLTVLTTHRLTLTAEPWIERVVVLANGTLAEQGKPHELYRKGGEYKRLMDLAKLGELINHPPPDSNNRQ